MTTTTYTVTGMTCEHCVRAVTTELEALGGVAGVSIELVPDGVSQVTVQSEQPLGTDAVAEALDEAGGYLLANA
jgi:copper chaperone